MGVTKGLAGRKLVGSLRSVGKKQEIHRREPRKTTTPTTSFLVYRGWNGIISGVDFRPRGLLEPVS